MFVVFCKAKLIKNISSTFNNVESIIMSDLTKRKLEILLTASRMTKTDVNYLFIYLYLSSFPVL